MSKNFIPYEDEVKLKRDFDNGFKIFSFRRPDLYWVKDGDKMVDQDDYTWTTPLLKMGKPSDYGQWE